MARLRIHHHPIGACAYLYVDVFRDMIPFLLLALILSNVPVLLFRSVLIKHLMRVKSAIGKELNRERFVGRGDKGDWNEVKKKKNERKIAGRKIIIKRKCQRGS